MSLATRPTLTGGIIVLKPPGLLSTTCGQSPRSARKEQLASERSTTAGKYLRQQQNWRESSACPHCTLLRRPCKPLGLTKDLVTDNDMAGDVSRGESARSPSLFSDFSLPRTQMVPFPFVSTLTSRHRLGPRLSLAIASRHLAQYVL